MNPPVDAAVDAALAAGATVVTPNRRLARELKRGFDRSRQQQAECGQALAVWPAADVLPWEAWLIRGRDEVVAARPEVEAPTLLTAAQQRVLWEQAVAASGIALTQRAVELLAESAGEAWDLLHQHGDASMLVHAGPLSDDQQAFATWCDAYARRLRQRRAIDTARLPGWLLRQVQQGLWRPSGPVLLIGFDRLRPAQRQLVEGLRGIGCSVDVLATMRDAAASAGADAAPAADVAAAAPVRVACSDVGAQWRNAAAWARARLSAHPQARIGIVVPDLHAHRDALAHALSEALAPMQRLEGAVDPADLPFNLSLGRPLAEHPLVASAQKLLDLAVGTLSIADAGHLLRSPYLAGGAAGEPEWSSRARIDASLRRAGRWQLTVTGMRDAAVRAPQLAQALQRVERRLAAAGTRPRPLSAWVALMFELLRDAGFPGSRPLDSAEYQAHQAWREALAGLATLDELLGPLSLSQALSRVRRHLADTVFQPESGDAAVQVLGVIESANLRFDHLWVANLADDRWPPAPQPNPLLPVAMQRAWGEPTASAEHALGLAQRQFEGWQTNANEVVFSHPVHDGDQELGPSPLIAALAQRPADALAVPVAPVARALARDLALAAFVDEAGPPVPPPPGAQPGGARLLDDQSACPFRGFAAHRLQARALERPEPGIDSRTRGALLHGMLQRFWHGLDSQQALLALDPAQRAARLRASAEAALDDLDRQRPGLIGPRLRRIEIERLARLGGGWLDIEAQRPPFWVVSVEAQAIASIGGLTLRLQPDRIDRLDNGALVVIDYKTGRVSHADWLGERPPAPQLPLYATMLSAQSERVHAIAFAQVRADGIRAVALSAEPLAIDGAKPIDAAITNTGRPGWEGLLADWRERLERLAAGYLAGEAAVAPARPTACSHCDLPSLCRLEERRGLAARLRAESEGEADDD
jgi:ATP-dependent helicase/nuclease subunit B